MEQTFTRDTPQARVEWHLACIEARRRGDKEPLAPWQQPPHTTSRQNFEQLALPSEYRETPATRTSRVAPSTPPLRANPNSTAPTHPELSAQKKLAIEYLLLRGGVPRELVATEDRVSQVYEAYLSFVTQGGERCVATRLNKYEIGRHFVVGTATQQAIDVADALLPLLAATSKVEVAARERYLHRFVDTLANKVNLSRRPAIA